MFIMTKSIELLIVETTELKFEDYTELKKLRIPKVFLSRTDNVPFFLENEDVHIDKSIHLFGYGSLFKDLSDRYKTKLNSVVIVSRNLSFISNCILEVQVGTILIYKGKIPEDQYGKMPDFHLDNFSKIKDVLNLREGYFTEVCLTLNQNLESLNDTGYVIQTNLIKEGFKVDVLAGGRYFNTNHSKHILHQPSRRIYYSKWNDSQEKLFFECYAGLLSLLNKDKILLTRVPPRSGKRDRFLNIVRKLSLEIENIENISNTIYTIKDYQEHKILNSEERYENVKNVFKVEDNLNRISQGHIVILDDVLTSGATIYECAKTYYLAGAKKVTAVVLGVNQFADDFNNDIKFICSSCNGEMELKISRQNKAFYGCRNYSSLSCNNTYSFEKGLEIIREELEKDEFGLLF